MLLRSTFTSLQVVIIFPSSLLLTKHPHLFPPAGTIYVGNSDMNQAKKLKRTKTKKPQTKTNSPPQQQQQKKNQFGPKSFSARSLSWTDWLASCKSSSVSAERDEEGEAEIAAAQTEPGWSSRGTAWLWTQSRAAASFFSSCCWIYFSPSPKQRAGTAREHW